MRENIPQKLRHVHIYFCGKTIGSTLTGMAAHSSYQFENARPPKRCHCENQDEDQRAHALRACAFAPCLEHSNQSNKEKGDSTACENFHRHFSSSELSIDLDFGIGTGSAQ